MTLKDLIQQYQAGLINVMAIGHAVKKEQICSELNIQYPGNIPSMGKFFMCVNSVPVEHVICSRSNVARRFISFAAGFQTYCGNQSTCSCNKENAKLKIAAVTDAEWRDRAAHRLATNKKVYGFEFASQHPDTKIKAENTCLQRYGVKSPTMNASVLIKSQATCMHNFGVQYPQQNASVVTKTEHTFVENYGTTRPAMNPVVVEKTKQTNLAKYGVSNPMQIASIAAAVTKKCRLGNFNKVVAARTLAVAAFTDVEYAESSSGDELPWICNKCQTVFLQTLLPGQEARCYACYPKESTWGENLIENWLVKNNVVYEKNIRSIISPYELDFYLPAYKVAIEFNGLYWHSELAGRGKGYHVGKFAACSQKHIRLIQIFEHELKFKEDIILSRLAHAINNTANRVGARALKVRKLDFATGKQFFTENHLQGFAANKVAYGLYQDELLISAMSFSKARYGKTDWELLRFANKLGYSIAGAANKLFKYAVRDNSMQSVTSYADLKWGLGNFYSNLGFKLSHRSKPNYWYFNSINSIQSRIAFQKHKLPLELHHLGSEWQIMQHLGYNRYWDCGNAVWVWDHSTKFDVGPVAIVTGV